MILVLQLVFQRSNQSKIKSTDNFSHFKELILTATSKVVSEERTVPAKAHKISLFSCRCLESDLLYPQQYVLVLGNEDNYTCVVVSCIDNKQNMLDFAFCVLTNSPTSATCLAGHIKLLRTAYIGVRR